MTKKPAHLAAIAALVLLTAGTALPAYAGPNEVALLSNYIGAWSGAGVLEGGDAPQPFTCRLTIDKGNQAKINYAGRCTLVNMNLSVSGTIAYDDASHTYQAIMGSNAGFKGVAVGRVKGGTITFDLAQKEKDRAGNAVRLGAQIILINNTSITVAYQVEFNDSGRILTATVPFSK
jgi:hypothetical protein